MQLPETKEAYKRKLRQAKGLDLYECKTKFWVIVDANNFGTICADAGIPLRINSHNVV